MPATRQDFKQRPIDGTEGSGDRADIKQTTRSSQIRKRDANQANRRYDERAKPAAKPADSSQPAEPAQPAGQQQQRSSERSPLSISSGAQSAKPANLAGLAPSSGSPATAGGSVGALRGKPAAASPAGPDSDIVNVANENRVVLNVGGIRHETYKVSMIGEKISCVRLALFALSCLPSPRTSAQPDSWPETLAGHLFYAQILLPRKQALIDSRPPRLPA